MKLETKDLMPYLPYKLNVHSMYNERIGILQSLDLNGRCSVIHKVIWNYEIGHIKPILRPLSDLTKEIEVDGKRFTPASLMITHGFHNKFWYDLENFNYKYLYALDYELLISWHFDIFKLIPQGLAIDIKTLK